MRDEIKKINNLEKEKKKLENYIYFTFSDQNLIHILKDLIGGITKYKEEKKEDSIKSFGEFCEHSHRFIFKLLNGIMKQKVYLSHYPNIRDWEVVEELQNNIFPELNIQNRDLLNRTRQIVDDYYNAAKHEYQRVKLSLIENLDFTIIIFNCIKIFLLSSYLSKNLLKRFTNGFYERFKKKRIKIENNFPLLFQKKDEEIIDLFWNRTFGTKNRDLLINTKILSLKEIENSRILQNYYPLYSYYHWRIENILSEERVYPFRTTGPQLIDFEKGIWVYKPKTVKYIINLLKTNKKSILIASESGTGKTVISRYVGYEFYKQGFDVYYIDCLKHRPKKIENVLDQLDLYSENRKRKLNSFLFIFENIHVLKDELKWKLNKCKKHVLCLITKRLFERELEKRKNLEKYKKSNFTFYQKINISLSHWTYSNTIKGILKQNTQDPYLFNQLSSIGNQNLWVYTIILKLLKESLELERKTSIIELFTDHELVGKGITEYYKNLLNTESIVIKSSEEDVYLNHIRYFLAILSILSEFELWTGRKFFEVIGAIKDNSRLGLLNKEINLDNQVLSDIQSFLIDTFEIESRIIDIKSGIIEKEFKIPHSQMSIIYKNCILKIFERSYYGIEEQIKQLYILHGKYFGSLISDIWFHHIRKVPREEKSERIKYFNFNKLFNLDFTNTYIKKGNPNLVLFRSELINRSLVEINRFFARFSTDYKDLASNILKYCLEDENILFNSQWKNKIRKNSLLDSYFFIYRLKNNLSEDIFIDFLRFVKIEIINKCRESKFKDVFRFVLLFYNIPIEKCNYEYNEISEILIKKQKKSNIFREISLFISEEIPNLNESYHLYQLFETLVENYIKYCSLKDESNIIYNHERHSEEILFKIYLSMIDSAANGLLEINFWEIYDKKFEKAEYYDILSYIRNLKKINKIIAETFFKNYENLLKARLKQDSEYLIDYLDALEFIFGKETAIPDFIITNWNWFEELLRDYLIDNKFSYHTIKNWFFEEIFPTYSKKILKLVKQLILEKLTQLKDPLEIGELLNPSYEGIEGIKPQIINLFNNSITNYLKVKDISYFTQFFNKSKDKYRVREYFEKEWDFENFLSNKFFLRILKNTSVNQLVEFIDAIEKYKMWKDIFLNQFRDLMEDKMDSEDLRLIVYPKEVRRYIRKIMICLSNFKLLELSEFINQDVSQDYSQLNCILIFLKSNLANYEKFLDFEPYSREFIPLYKSSKFKKELILTEPFTILNFLTILKRIFPSLMIEILKEYQDILELKFSKIEPCLNDIILLLTLYRLDIELIKEIDSYFNSKSILVGIIISWINQLDLLSLRYILSHYRVCVKFSNYFNIKKIIKNSSLLQISIALINISIHYQKYGTRLKIENLQLYQRQQIRSIPEDVFESLIEKIFSLIPPLQRNHLAFGNYNDYERRIIFNPILIYSDTILKLFKESPIEYISFYLVSLATWRYELEEQKLELPLEFQKYFTSSAFREKFFNSAFFTLYKFLGILSDLYPSLFTELIKLNKISFCSVDFEQKLKDAYFIEIFWLYLHIFNDFKVFPANLKSLIREKLNLLNFTTLIHLLKGVKEEYFTRIIETFSEEIIEIIKKSSKHEILYSLKRLSYKKDSIEKNQEKSILKTFPILEEKLNEKYFFES